MSRHKSTHCVSLERNSHYKFHLLPVYIYVCWVERGWVHSYSCKKILLYVIVWYFKTLEDRQYSLKFSLLLFSSNGSSSIDTHSHMTWHWWLNPIRYLILCCPQTLSSHMILGAIAWLRNIDPILERLPWLTMPSVTNSSPSLTWLASCAQGILNNCVPHTEDLGISAP